MYNKIDTTRYKDTERISKITIDTRYKIYNILTNCLNVQEMKILKMIQPSTHQAKHAHNSSYSIGLLINGIKTKITQDPVKRVPPGGCATS
jgi:hypothetical protein